MPWTVACQASLFMGFSMQEYWSELPFPSPGYLPNPGMEPRSPALWQVLYHLPPPKCNFIHKAKSSPSFLYLLLPMLRFKLNWDYLNLIILNTMRKYREKVLKMSIAHQDVSFQTEEKLEFLGWLLICLPLKATRSCVSSYWQGVMTKEWQNHKCSYWGASSLCYPEWKKTDEWLAASHNLFSLLYIYLSKIMCCWSCSQSQLSRCISLNTLFVELWVGKAWAQRLEEISRSCRTARHVYYLLDDAEPIASAVA